MSTEQDTDHDDFYGSWRRTIDESEALCLAGGIEESAVVMLCAMITGLSGAALHIPDFLLKALARVDALNIRLSPVEGPDLIDPLAPSQRGYVDAWRWAIDRAERHYANGETERGDVVMLRASLTAIASAAQGAPELLRKAQDLNNLESARARAYELLATEESAHG